MANKIACHHCSQDSGAWLYRESDWDDFRSTTLYTKASSKNKFSKIPGISDSSNSSSRVIWEASGNWSGKGTKVITTVLRKLRETATRTVLWERRTRFKSISEFMELSQHAIYKDEERMTKISDISLTRCKMDIAPIPSWTIWKRKVFQRSIEASSQRNGQHCFVQTRRNIQNNSMPIVVVIFQRRNSLMLMCNMSHVLAWTNRKDQESNWHHIKSTIHHKRRCNQENVMDQNSGSTIIGKRNTKPSAVKQRNFKCVEHRWLTDPQYQQSQSSHGWTLEYCTYLDYLKTVHLDHVANWEKEIDTRTCTYCGIKTEIILERCQYEIIWNW